LPSLFCSVSFSSLFLLFSFFCSCSPLFFCSCSLLVSILFCAVLFWSGLFCSVRFGSEKGPSGGQQTNGSALGRGWAWIPVVVLSPFSFSLFPLSLLFFVSLNEFLFRGRLSPSCGLPTTENESINQIAEWVFWRCWFPALLVRVRVRVRVRGRGRGGVTRVPGWRSRFQVTGPGHRSQVQVQVVEVGLGLGRGRGGTIRGWGLGLLTGCWVSGCWFSWPFFSFLGSSNQSTRSQLDRLEAGVRKGGGWAGG
jgi:hypothetical protein